MGDDKVRIGFQGPRKENDLQPDQGWRLQTQQSSCSMGLRYTSISFSLQNIQQSHLPLTIQPVSSAWRFEMQINPLLNSDSTVVFVGEDGRLGNVNLTSGLSQRMNGNLSFVSIIFFVHYNHVEEKIVSLSKNWVWHVCLEGKSWNSVYFVSKFILSIKS